MIVSRLLSTFQLILLISSSYAQNAQVSPEQDIEQALNGVDVESLLTSLQIEGPTPCPQDTSIEGYSNITQMVIDLAMTQIFNPMPETFTICPNTVYNITTELSIENPNYHLPIVVPFDDITVNCGVDGNVDNNCVLSGGYVHAVLGGKNSILNGFTFKESIGVSVVTAGPSPFSAQFKNCLWQGNKGYGLLVNQMLFRSILEVVMDSESLMALLPTSPDISGLPPSLGEGMTVSFETCSFLDNDVEIGLMYSNYSSIVINNGLFEKNSAKVADIILQNGSTGTISNTCFSEEQNQALGIVYVSSDSTLLPNGVSSYSTTTPTSLCADIFKETVPSNCLTNSAECMDVKSCEEFESTSIEGTACKAMTISPAAGSASSGTSTSDVENPTPEAASASAGSPAPTISTKFHSIATLIPLAFAWLII